MASSLFLHLGISLLLLPSYKLKILNSILPFLWDEVGVGRKSKKEQETMFLPPFEPMLSSLGLGDQVLLGDTVGSLDTPCEHQHCQHFSSAGALIMPVLSFCWLLIPATVPL